MANEFYNPKEKFFRRDDVYQAAKRLADNRGISQVTRARIAAAAGVSTGTVSHYFGDMSALRDELYRDRGTPTSGKKG